MTYFATFTPPDAAPLFFMGCPDEANEWAKVELGLSEADYCRMKDETASLSIRIEREPLAPRKPDGITIKENADSEDDDDTAKRYIVLNKYFPKGQYTFHDCNVHLHVNLPSDGPVTQEEFEASYRKLLSCGQEGQK